MKSWEHELGDVLIINYRGVEQPARVAGYFDSLDNRTPLYVNLRVSEGKRWGQRQVKIQPEQILRADPDWYERQQREWDAQLKKDVDEIYAKMTPEQRRGIHRDAVRLGISLPEPRSAIDILIDRACGIE